MVAIQCVENLFYFCLFGELIEVLRRDGGVRVEQIVARGMRSPSDGRGARLLARTTWRFIRSNILTDNKWVRIFNAYANGIAYRSAMPLLPWHEWRIARQAHVVWKSLRDKDTLVALSVNGIPIGDLVADSYLRMRPSPVLAVSDPFLRIVIRQALRDMHKALSYFRKTKPVLFLTSYTSYVEHGVAARAAAFLGIRVQAFGNYQSFSKHIVFGYLVHQPRLSGYRMNFLQLDDQTYKAAQGEARLAARLSGELDLATSYMKSSGYGAPQTNLPDLKGVLVVFLHDFYDSPHAYEWMLFHDFWEWVCFTIETLRDKKIPFFLKPHPNQIAASAADFARLKQLYPGLRILPPDVSNRHLADAGISCAVTVYGSVAAEMAHMGVPSISCADNPHIAFDFGLTARTREEYRNFLENHDNLSRDVEQMRKEAGAFYYIHNMHLSAGQAELRDKFVRINLKMTDADQQIHWTADSVLNDFRDLAASPGFPEFVRDLSVGIRGASNRPSHL